jgi:tetratricopeptide (TPR) repeat protein
MSGGCKKSNRLAGFAAAWALALVAALPARADTVWLRSGTAANALERPNVKVEKIEDNLLFFRSSQSDRVTERPLEEVLKIMADGEPVFNAAEEAFAAGEWDKAAVNYQKAVVASPRQWVKDRSSLRLVASAEKSGKFSTAVAGWVALLTRDPGLAAKHKPQIPASAKPGSLDPAVAEVERALGDARLPAQPRQTLLAYQMELARANGDLKRAQSIGTKLTGAGGAAAAATPELSLQLAFLALDQKQYEQALKEIDGAAASFTDPQQQTEALYCVAEARAALAKDDPAALKDAALAYMRVVARARSARVNSPRVGESLLKTAAIQEKVGAAKEALLLYQQAAEEFKGSDTGARAAEAVDRLGKSAKSES